MYEGQQLAILVGEGGQGARDGEASRSAFGFGGIAFKEGGGGGGLTGIFDGKVERITRPTPAGAPPPVTD